MCSSCYYLLDRMKKIRLGKARDDGFAHQEIAEDAADDRANNASMGE